MRIPLVESADRTTQLKTVTGIAPQHGNRSGAAGRFRAWLRSPAGNRLLAAERPLLGEAARRFHGDALLWIGSTPVLLDTVSRSMVRVRCYAAPDFDGGATGVPEDVEMVAADAAELPLPSGSVDGVVLHHVLETACDRRIALREAARVLRAGGRLLVLGVNPFSLWLLAKVRLVCRDWKPVSVPRLNDWLALLGLEREEKTIYLNYRCALPFALDGERWRAASGWLNRLRPPVGGVYLIAAVKVGHGFIAERRLLAEQRRSLGSAALPNPATRQTARTLLP